MPKRKLIMTVNLPTDLILQILSRLPSKSIARFRCVSKLWKSLLTLGSPYFTELFLTQSITRPRLLFVIEIGDAERYLYSCPQISCKNSESSISISVKAEFHMHMSLPDRAWSVDMFTQVSGLLYWSTIGNYNSPMLCNPTTRHRFSLPNLTRAEDSFLGYNPINKQFSVLAITSPLPSNQHLPSSYQILNLESGRLSWRSLDCPLHHFPLASHICINGILYYGATFWKEYPCKIVCFDLNSEEFKFIDQPWPNKFEVLVNFKGKLGGITTQSVENGKEGLNLELWVLEDVVKEKWSKYVHLLPSIFLNTKVSHYRVVGLTSTGDVVLYKSSYFTVDPFYVYFFNLEKNILRKVEIKGLERFKDNYFKCCVDYVEDLKALNWS